MEKQCRYRIVNSPEVQGLVELHPEGELHHASTFGFYWIAPRVQHLMVPQANKAAPIPTDVARGGGI